MLQKELSKSAVATVYGPYLSWLDGNFARCEPEPEPWLTLCVCVFF